MRLLGTMNKESGRCCLIGTLPRRHQEWVHWVRLPPAKDEVNEKIEEEGGRPYNKTCDGRFTDMVWSTSDSRLDLLARIRKKTYWNSDMKTRLLREFHWSDSQQAATVCIHICSSETRLRSHKKDPSQRNASQLNISCVRRISGKLSISHRDWKWDSAARIAAYGSSTCPIRLMVLQSTQRILI